MPEQCICGTRMLHKGLGVTHCSFQSVAHLASRVLRSLSESQTMPPFLRATVKHRSAGRIMPQSQALCLVQTIHLGPVAWWKFSVAKFFGIKFRRSCCRSFQSVLQKLLQEFFSGCKVTHPTFFTQKPGKRLKPNIHRGEVCRCLYFKHFKTTYRPPI